MTEVHPIIEAMARAFAKSCGPRRTWKDEAPSDREMYRRRARAALAAALDHMAEPSDGMLAAVHPDEDCDIVRQKVINACREMEAGFYRVMLAELRKEVLGDDHHTR